MRRKKMCEEENLTWQIGIKQYARRTLKHDASRDILIFELEVYHQPLAFTTDNKRVMKLLDEQLTPQGFTPDLCSRSGADSRLSSLCLYIQ